MKSPFKIKDIESLGFLYEGTKSKRANEDGIDYWKTDEYRKVIWNNSFRPPVIHELWKITICEEIVRITVEVKDFLGEPSILFYGRLKSLDELTTLLTQVNYLKEPNTSTLQK